VQDQVADLPEDAPLPMVHCAVTGEALFLQDRTDAVARFPTVGALYEQARTRGSACVPLAARGATFGALAVGYADARPFRPADRDLLQALAALTAQALDRLRAHEAEQRASAQIRRLSESLQRSLLSPPPHSDVLQVAVRYQPAVQEAQVGGDWYDAFTLGDGRTTLVVGDVAGHDRDAAAAMAQVRNVLRGVAQTHDGPPSSVLCALDGALARLEASTLATAVLCQVTPAHAGVVLRWSNAGHPPPVLLHPDGAAELLTRDPQLLLGIAPDVPRQDHDLVLLPATTLVLFTDGLVERRGVPLDEALERLRAEVGELHGLAPEELADALLERLAAGAEDDVALLVVRVGAAS
jgi:serine phosphatase RsbU (regulator of sigma subunit)